MINTRKLRIVTLAGAFLLASCGSDGSDQADDAATADASDGAVSTTDTAAVDSTPTVATDTASTTTDEPVITEPEVVGTEPTAADDGAEDSAENGAENGAADLPDVELDEADDGPTASLASPAMGGVRFEAAEQNDVSIGDDFVSVRIAEPGDDMKPEANVVLITQDVTGAPIATISDYMAAVAIDPTAVVEPTGDGLDLLGHRLTGYEVSNGGVIEDPMLFSANRAGAEVNSVAAPFPYSRVYLAETPAGVLQAAIEGLDAEHAQQAAGAFSLLVESIEFTGPGLDAPLPPGEVLEPSTAAPPPDAAPLAEGGAPPLETAFAPVDPAAYQLLNTGLQTTIDVPDGWFVQPNFPGIIVFTAPDSQGPGDRDLVITRNVSEIVPTGAGPRAVGPVQTIDGIDAFFENLPTGISVSDVTEVDFGTATGVQFDLTTDPTSDCSDDDPCELSMLTTFGFVKPLQANSDHRIWWIDTPDGSLVMVAMAVNNPEFIDQATGLALSLTVA